MAVCTTISALVFCQANFVTEPWTTRVRRGTAWDDMQQTTRDGVDLLEVATDSSLTNFSRWHPALEWSGLEWTGMDWTVLDYSAHHWG